MYRVFVLLIAGGFALTGLAKGTTPDQPRPWMTNIVDSTGRANTGSAVLSWQNSGRWSHCNAASQGCGSTTGYQTQVVTCRADGLDGSVSTVSEHLCLKVVSSIGPKPRGSQTCTINWGRCVPPPPTPSTGGFGIGYCGASVAVCKAYDDTFGRAPEAGSGPAFWDQWVRDTGHKPGSAKFQKAFEDGAQGSDCDKLFKSQSPHC